MMKELPQVAGGAPGRPGGEIGPRHDLVSEEDTVVLLQNLADGLRVSMIKSEKA